MILDAVRRAYRLAATLAIVAPLICAPGVGAAQPAPPSTSPSAVAAVVAQLESSKALETKLSRGIHAVLVLGAGSEVDKTVCELFVYVYRERFGGQSDKIIYFPSSFTGPKPTCEAPPPADKWVYDGGLRSTTLHDRLLAHLQTTNPILLVVCVDARSRLINKGYVVFHPSPPPPNKAWNPAVDKGRFQNLIDDFEAYYRLPPTRWMDEKEIDRPSSGPVDWAWDKVTTAFDYVPGNGPKNTPCH